MNNEQKSTESSAMPTKFWMSLEQAESPAEFTKNIPGEFTSSPIREGAEKEGLGRRDFMKLMGASALMASLAGCSRRPIQKIVPYVNNPEEIIPGVPNFYASVDPSTGYGLLVKTREGRPIKVDGNTDHPLNKGALNARGQAMIHDLYDPDRLRAPKIDGVQVEWAAFDAEVKKALSAGKGANWILTSSVLSPTVKAAIAGSGLRHVMLDSVPMDDVLDAQSASFGGRVFPRYRFDQADLVVSIDADFLQTWGSSVEYAKQFASKRRMEGNKISMSKLVCFESAPHLTGQNADERHVIHPADQLLIALSLASEVARLSGRSVDELSAYAPSSVAPRVGLEANVLQNLAKELVKYRGRSLVVAAGKGAQAVALQNVVNFLNATLDNEGETVDATLAPSAQYQGSYAEFERLLNAIRTGSVKTLIIQGVNPAYLFADSVGLKDAFAKVPNLIYVGSYMDETASLAKFVAAESHGFEAWGDASPRADVYSIMQPTIRPLWQTKSLLELLLDWSPATGANLGENAYEAVRNTWKSLHKKYGVPASFDSWWDDVLMSGVFAPHLDRQQAASSSKRSFRMDALKSAISAARNAGKKSGEDSFTLVLTRSGAMGDGSQANNALLQELPDPVSKNTWGNYLAVAPSTAKKMGWLDGDIVRVENAAGSAVLPLYRQPGLAPDVVATHVGYGRKFDGRVGSGVGITLASFTASSQGIMPSMLVAGVKITKTGQKEKIPCTQGHHTLEGRDIVFDTTIEEYRENPKSGIVRHFPNPASIWSGHEYTGYKWGMAIDLSNCTGCSACVVACSVENNVPAVGKEQVQKGREMQWIRIDRYYSGESDSPETIFQPMLCQHCDNAPCETVCPVLATTHSNEGLNQMTYNRCVGTKYCSNNCPYKVRRFNWFNNNGDMNEILPHPSPLKFNPEVTIRSRGVMEKCTFCVQRIESAKSAAKTAGRRVGEGDIRTACQDACPSDAIVFGDLNNPESRVAKLSKHPRGFYSLEELNAKPAISYLTKVRNRPASPKAEAKGEEGGHHA